MRQRSEIIPMEHTPSIKSGLCAIADYTNCI